MDIGVSLPKKNIILAFENTIKHPYKKIKISYQPITDLIPRRIPYMYKHISSIWKITGINYKPQNTLF